jgi:acetyl esterase/lipase
MSDEKIQNISYKSQIQVTIIRDLAYASQSEAQKLDIYMQTGIKKSRPVIIWIHPGGFIAGDKDGSVAGGAEFALARVNMISLIQPMLERGYSVVSINYRLSGEATFPALIYDVKAAVRWVKANAAKYNFNPEKVAAWGSSSGGYLAAMLAASSDVPDLEDLSLGNPGFSSRVTAAIDWYGPIDFLAMDPQHLKLGQEAHVHEASSHESLLMGASVTSVPEKCKLASPITHVNPGSAPLYIQQGTGDPVIPYFQSIDLAEKMKAAIGEENVGLDLIEKVGHADSVFFTLSNIHKMLDFLDKYMK